MTHIRKFIVALVGAGVLILGRRWGLESPAYTDLVAVLTALGVYAVPNS